MIFSGGRGGFAPSWVLGQRPNKRVCLANPMLAIRLAKKGNKNEIKKNRKRKTKTDKLSAK